MITSGCPRYAMCGIEATQVLKAVTDPALAEYAAQQQHAAETSVAEAPEDSLE